MVNKKQKTKKTTYVIPKETMSLPLLSNTSESAQLFCLKNRFALFYVADIRRKITEFLQCKAPRAAASEIKCVGN